MGRKRGGVVVMPDVAERPIGPTKETLAKIEEDVARVMYLTGVIKQHHWDAVEEIREMDEAIGRGMFPMSRPQSGGRVKGYRARDFLDHMSAGEITKYENHYAPWMNAIGRKQAFVYAVVIANEKPQTNAFKELFINGLHLYAEIAGFCSRKNRVLFDKSS